jgi:hypothetical protein
VKTLAVSSIVSTRFSKERPAEKRKHRAKPAGAGKMILKTLDHLDGRTLASRRAHELIKGISRDLTGDDDVSQLTEGTPQARPRRVAPEFGQLRVGPN